MSRRKRATVGYIHSINASKGGVPKKPLVSAIVGTLGIEGDQQANTEHHGGPDRALCLFSLERIEALQAEGHPIQPGDTGENLTLAGLDWAAIQPGLQLKLGNDVLIEITSHTPPCQKIKAAFTDGDFNRINQSTHPGWSRAYARVIEGGQIHPPSPARPLT